MDYIIRSLTKTYFLPARRTRRIWHKNIPTGIYHLIDAPQVLGGFNYRDISRRQKDLSRNGSGQLMEAIKPRTTVAIVDGIPLISEALELLLRECGYGTCILDYPLPEDLEKFLGEVQLLILANPYPGLNYKGLVESVMDAQAVTKIPVLELITASSTKTAATRLGYPVRWPCRIGDLKQKIEAALKSGPLHKA